MMNARTANLPELIALVVPIPAKDHRIYREAQRILRCLMGRKAPSLETLVLHDLCGREATGIADHYLDSIEWPLERGRAVTVRMREGARCPDRSRRQHRRPAVKFAKPPADPTRN